MNEDSRKRGGFAWFDELLVAGRTVDSLMIDLNGFPA